VAILAALWTVLSSATRESGLPLDAQRRVRLGSALYLGAWLAAALFFAPQSLSVSPRDAFRIAPLIPLLAGTSMVIALVALWRSASLRRVLSVVPVSALHAMQSWRVLGFTFLILLAQGQLPAHFALPAGWGDVFIGLTAPIVAVALARGTRGAGALAVAWNVLGLLDLVVAVGMGTGVLASLLMPGLGRVPPAAAMGMYPMILVPAFAVPASLLVHVVALTGLSRGYRPAPTLVPHGTPGAA
jgi:hypothetical protein